MRGCRASSLPVAAGSGDEAGWVWGRGSATDVSEQS